MTKIQYIFQIVFFVMFSLVSPLFSQELDSEPTDITVSDSGYKFQLQDNFHIFLNSMLIFPLSVYEGGFGLGETITFQFRLPFKINVGFETGYYGFKSEAETDGYYIIGGYSIIPILVQASYDYRIVENVYVTPVLKVGVGFTSAAINGWLRDSTLSVMFEGGVRLKGIVAGGLLIQGNLTYTGLIEKSGLFSIMSLGFGFGL